MDDYLSAADFNRTELEPLHRLIKAEQSQLDDFTVRSLSIQAELKHLNSMISDKKAIINNLEKEFINKIEMANNG
jgi:hypothetical protein